MSDCPLEDPLEDMSRLPNCFRQTIQGSGQHAAGWKTRRFEGSESHGPQDDLPTHPSPLRRRGSHSHRAERRSARFPGAHGTTAALKSEGVAGAIDEPTISAVITGYVGEFLDHSEFPGIGR